MDLVDMPRHRPFAFDKMESLIKELQDPETGVKIKSTKLFLNFVPSAFQGYDLVEWLMDRFNLDDTSNVEAINLANQLCQYGYFFPVNDLKNLAFRDDNGLYRFQTPYYWPWQTARVAGSGSAPSLGPDNVEYAIYLVKRTLRNKQRHALEDYEQEALSNLKKNLAAKWDFITMQAEEQVRLAKNRTKGDKIVSDSQERAYWRVARPPPGTTSALDGCPVPVRARLSKPKRRTVQQLQREIDLLKTSLDRTRVKTSIALEALAVYTETFAPYDPWLTPPLPSNPWISDDTLFWQINSPIVEVPTEKRVQRWAISIEELLADPTGLAEFTSFLRKEYSHENIRFWLAVKEMRRSSTKSIPGKLLNIYEEFLKPGAPCEINIDGATADKVVEGLRTGSRYALDHAADHVYGLLLKKDCYPRFIRSDHFQRLLTEGRNVHQKKKFFNFGGQVKKKPSSSSGTGGGGSSGSGAGAMLSRRRGSDRSLSGSAHELAVCAAQPPRYQDPPLPYPHSHSQSNLCDIPFRDPLDDSTDEALPWESASRDGSVYGAGRRRQDSTADSGSSSSELSAAVAVCSERARRLPQQSTLDGGLRGAPPPLRRLSAVEPRHLAPLASPPRSPRTAPAATAAPAQPPAACPPHPTPTISVSSAPDDECSSPGARSLAHTDEPSSVFASADVTPTADPLASFEDRCALDLRAESATAVQAQGLDSSRTDDTCEVSVEVRVRQVDEPRTRPRPSGSAARTDSRDSDERTRSSENDVIVVRRALTREPSTMQEAGLPSSEDSGGIGNNLLRSAGLVRTESDMPSPPVPHAVPATPMASPAPAGSGSTGPSLATGPVFPATPRTPVGPVVPVVPVAPLAEGEDIGVDDDNVDKVPSAPLQRVSRGPEAASETGAGRSIAHGDELSAAVSEPNNVKRDNKGERQQRNDVCPWEDENSCESDAPFVKTYATLGYL